MNHADIDKYYFGRNVEKVKIVAHTMEYQGGHIVSQLRLRNYSDFDYDDYKRVYNECFHDMRKALQLFPVDCCDSKEADNISPIILLSRIGIKAQSKCS